MRRAGRAGLCRVAGSWVQRRKGCSRIPLADGTQWLAGRQPLVNALNVEAMLARQHPQLVAVPEALHAILSAGKRDSPGKNLRHSHMSQGVQCPAKPGQTLRVQGVHEASPAEQMFAGILELRAGPVVFDADCACLQGATSLGAKWTALVTVRATSAVVCSCCAENSL